MIKSIFETLLFYHDQKKALSASLHWIFHLNLSEINRKHFDLHLTFRCKAIRFFPMMTMFTNIPIRGCQVTTFVMNSK